MDQRYKNRNFKLLEDQIGKMLKDIGIAKHFLKRTPITQEKIPRTNIWNYNVKKLI